MNYVLISLIILSVSWGIWSIYSAIKGILKLRSSAEEIPAEKCRRIQKESTVVQERLNEKKERAEKIAQSIIEACYHRANISENAFLILDLSVWPEFLNSKYSSLIKDALEREGFRVKSDYGSVAVTWEKL